MQVAHVADQQHRAMALPLASELGPNQNSPSSLPMEGDIPEHGALPLPGSGELGDLGTRQHGALPLPDDAMQGRSQPMFHCCALFSRDVQPGQSQPTDVESKYSTTLVLRLCMVPAKLDNLPRFMITQRAAGNYVMPCCKSTPYLNCLMSELDPNPSQEMRGCRGTFWSASHTDTRGCLLQLTPCLSCSACERDPSPYQEMKGWRRPAAQALPHLR